MAEVAAYNYSDTVHLIEPFPKNWGGEGPFIKDGEHLYGDLWQFKPEVERWTFTINKFRDCVLLRYRVKDSSTFVNWSLLEKVSVIENHQKNYVVITLQATDGGGKPRDHVHSIVCHDKSAHGVFDFEELIESLASAGTTVLLNELKRKFEPWARKDAEIMTRKINSIFQSLEKYAYQNVKKVTNAATRNTSSRQQSAGEPDAESGGRRKSTSRGSALETGRAPQQKRKPIGSETDITNEKRQKRAEDSRPTTAGSSGSVLTSVQPGRGKNEKPIQNFELAAAYQKNFLEQNQECFIFGSATFQVSIAQCYLARERYIIRKLEPRIVEDMKKSLVLLSDINMRQKVCLTPVDENRRLLKEPPKDWDSIKDGQFFIINGQYSITASKLLQKGECSEIRKKELQTWEAVIVWSLDAAKLTAISQWYNTTNHLQISQPTWGNQIFACREIWLSAKRPTDRRTDAATRENEAKYAPETYVKFVDAVLIRFQSLNPEKEGKNIKVESDVKNEIQIVTLKDDIYNLWEEFFKSHMRGLIINPATQKTYSEDKGFNLSQFVIKREFFKHLGHFSDKDLHENVLHLLGRSRGRTRPYPKVSIRKTRILVEDNRNQVDWVERRKRKKILIEEFHSADSSLSFKTIAGDVDDEKWRSWKKVNFFTSATWDFLVNATPNAFFVKRLQNEGKKKRAVDYKDKEFPVVYPMLRRFLSMKKDVVHVDGHVHIRGHECYPQAFVSSHSWAYMKRPIRLGVIDFRLLPRPSAGSGNSSPVASLLNFLTDHMRPSISGPDVWVWILGNQFDEEAAATFATKRLRRFGIKHSLYYPAKAERMDGVNQRGVVPPVSLFFLMKREEDGTLKGIEAFKKEYVTSDIPFYTQPRFNSEAKYRTHQSELRMEFYIELLQNFAVSGENVISVYAGSKFLLAAKMTGVSCYAIADRHDREKLREMVKFGERADVNDFSHDNSPYLGNYVRPRLIASPELNSDSSPSRRQNVQEAASESPEAAKDQETSLNIDQFGSNADVMLPVGDVETVIHDLSESQVEKEPTPPSDEEPVAKKRKGKDPLTEPTHFDVNLSDYEDDYSDLDGQEFDAPFPDEAGTSGAQEVELPLGDDAHGTSSGALIPPIAFAAPAVVVKSENLEFWTAREFRKAEKRAQEVALKEKFDLMEAENRRLKLQIHEASMSLPMSSSQAGGADVEQRVPVSVASAEQPAKLSDEHYLRLEDTSSVKCAPLLESVVPQAFIGSVAALLRSCKNPSNSGEGGATPAAQLRGSAAASSYLRVEDSRQEVALPDSDSAAVFRVQPDENPVDPVQSATVSASQEFNVETENPCDDDDDVDYGNINDDVDYGNINDVDDAGLEFGQEDVTSQ